MADNITDIKTPSEVTTDGTTTTTVHNNNNTEVRNDTLNESAIGPALTSDHNSSDGNDGSSADNSGAIGGQANDDCCDQSMDSSALDTSLNTSQDMMSGEEGPQSVQTKPNASLSAKKAAQKSLKKKRKLTPIEKKKALEERNKRLAEKQLEKEKKERELKEKKDLIEKQRLEKQRQKEVEKEMKEKERQEKEKERLEKEVEKQRIKEEKDKQKEKEKREREEKQKEKDLEKQKKLDEIAEKKRKLEEEKTRRLSEKQKASEEQLKKEEKQRKLLSNFFSKNSPNQPPVRKSVLTTDETNANPLFLPFDLGVNQTLAPVVSQFAKQRFNQQVLDQFFETQDSNELYLNTIKRNDYKVFRRNKRDKSEPEIIIESTSEGEDNQKEKYRIKHLQFHTNVRPPYRGTFRKKSCVIKSIKPFSKDTDLFDYEVDSDEDWDEGGPGESLNGSDSEGSVKDDYEIDNEFFVPHGYLSEDENDENEDNMNATVVSQDVEMTDDNDKSDAKDIKSLPLLKEQVLMAERNRSFSRTMNPQIIGCVWESKADINHKLVDSLKFFRRMAIRNK